MLSPLTREPLLNTRRDLPAFCHIITENPLKVAPLQPLSTFTYMHTPTAFPILDVRRWMHVGALEKTCRAEC